MVDANVLFLMLEWIVKGGAGPISQWICERWPWFQKQTSGVKIVLAVGVSSVVGMLSYVLAVAMLYQPAPVGWREWVGTLVAAAVVASSFAQIIHRLPKKQRA